MFFRVLLVVFSLFRLGAARAPVVYVYNIVFARPYYRGLLLGAVLVDTRKCELPSFNICLPYDIYILGGFSRCFLGFF